MKKNPLQKDAHLNDELASLECIFNFLSFFFLFLFFKRRQFFFLYIYDSKTSVISKTHVSLTGINSGQRSRRGENSRRLSSTYHLTPP